MKKLNILFFLCLSFTGLHAQLKLDVEGDAKISGRLDIRVGTNLYIGQNSGNPHNESSLYNTAIGRFTSTIITTGSENVFVS